MRWLRSTVVFATTLTLVACGTSSTSDTDRSSQGSHSTQMASDPEPSPSLCAEFPAIKAAPAGDFEGWWNSTPADADGEVLNDPDLWPEPNMREHPRVALVDGDAREVIIIYDRMACEHQTNSSYVPPVGMNFEERTIAIVDVDTGELLLSVPK